MNTVVKIAKTSGPMQMTRNTSVLILPLALAVACTSAPDARGQGFQTVRLGVFSAQHRMLGQPRGFGSGQPAQGYLGIGFHDVGDDRITALKLKEPHGAEIVHVDHDGPAGQAGLREHDVILQVNTQVIEGEEQLRRVLHEIPVGRSITIVISRDGQQQSITAQMADRTAVERQAWDQRYSVPAPASSFHGGNGFLGGRPIGAPDMDSTITAPPDPPAHSFIGGVILGSSYTGAALELIGPQLAQFFGSQGGNGLLVRSVDPKSPAATSGLRAGDVVVRANAVIIASTTDWYRLVRENKGKPLSIVIVRDKQEQTLVLVPDSKKRSGMEREAIPLDLDPQAASEQARGSNREFLRMN